MPPDFITITPSILYFGTPVVLVVTRNPDGSANITPISSAWALGSRIVVGLGMVGQGIANLQRERECTLNLPSADSWKKVESIARTTGLSPVPDDKARAGYGHEPDKFSLGGFTPRASDIVRPRGSPNARSSWKHGSWQPIAAHPIGVGRRLRHISSSISTWCGCMRVVTSSQPAPTTSIPGGGIRCSMCSGTISGTQRTLAATFGLRPEARQLARPVLCGQRPKRLNRVPHGQDRRRGSHASRSR